VIKQRRRSQNRLGFAVQLAVLRFPGRTLTDLPSIPPRVLASIAHQVAVPVGAFARYGTRQSTIDEHLDELRSTFGYTNYRWRAARHLMRHLVPLAMESDRPAARDRGSPRRHAQCQDHRPRSVHWSNC
jgi:TnpA family transposase